jgi:hypothetical protein
MEFLIQEEEEEEEDEVEGVKVWWVEAKKPTLGFPANTVLIILVTELNCNYGANYSTDWEKFASTFSNLDPQQKIASHCHEIGSEEYATQTALDGYPRYEVPPGCRAVPGWAEKKINSFAPHYPGVWMPEGRNFYLPSPAWVDIHTWD